MATLEGPLLKDGGWRRGWRKRYFKLTKIYFQYYENECSTSPKGAAVRGTITDVQVSDLKKLQFRVAFKNEVWELQAESTPELIKWMETLKPKSATNIMRVLSAQTSAPHAATMQSVSTFQAERTEHGYAPLAHMQPSQRHSVATDGRSTPMDSLDPRLRAPSVSSVHSSVSTASMGSGSTASNQHTQLNERRSLPAEVPAQSTRLEHPRMSLPTIFQAPKPADFKQRSASFEPARRAEDDYLEPDEYCDPALSMSRPRDPTPDLNTPRNPLPPSPNPRVPQPPSPNPRDPPPDPRGSVTTLTTASEVRETLTRIAAGEVSDIDLSSDDEFLDFDDESRWYMNDPRESMLALETLRKEIRTLHSSDASSTGEPRFTPENPNLMETDSAVPAPPTAPPKEPPTFNIIPDTLERTRNANYSTQHPPDKPDIDIHDASSDFEPSPIPQRRTIVSQKSSGNVNYSVQVVGGEEDKSLPIINIKSTEPVSRSVTLNKGDTNSTFLSAKTPGNASRITTLRIQEWIKKVQPVKKEFVDPEEQELGQLDTFLLEHAQTLPKDHITLIQKIGNGAFGEVWKARCVPPVNGDHQVAVKCLKEGSNDKHRHDFYGEAALLGQFQHPNVIALHGVILQEQSPWIVIEYASLGSLKAFVKKHGAERHSNQLLNYCRDMVRGMRYLSERGYIHRDLAARNVLLTKLEVCKIADFGLSRKLGDDDDIYVSRGGMVAIKWTAPEGVLGASYSSASDVWSCGITMWEVFSDGANPWSGQSNEQAFRSIRKGGRLARPEKCPLDVYKAMLKCWEANPMDRPTFSELDRLLFDPETDNLEQPLYENSDGFVQYLNLKYENMDSVEQA